MISKVYSKYKPSGVEWLGDVPEHWGVLPLKRIVAIPITDGPHETPEILDEGVPFVSAEAIRLNKIDFNKKRGFISEQEHRRFCLKYHPKRDDIFMIKSGATTGNLAIVETDEEFSIWSPLAVIRVHKRKADARFVLAAMNSKEFQTSVQLFWSFGTQQNIGMNVIENLPIPLPPLPEQQAIAVFLDRETGRIDALIAKKQRLLELLAEQRTALISRAVTKGLDASVKMKPSGVEWLGDVPEHWGALPLRRVVKTVKTGGTPAGAEDSAFEDDGFNWYSPSDFSDTVILGRSNRSLSDEGKEEVLIFPPNTVMLVGIGATIGKVGLSLNESSCNQQINGIICGERLEPKFATYYLKTMRDFIVKCGKYTTLPIINQDETKNLFFTLPTLPEQQTIAAFLDRETAKIDTLSAKVTTVIERLKEYRTAIISSAVTGKIDVLEAV